MTETKALATRLSTATRRDLVAQCMAYGMSNPKEIAETLDENYRIVIQDVKIIQEKIIPYFQDLDVDRIASESIATYKRAIKSAGRDVIKADKKIREYDDEEWTEENKDERYYWMNQKKTALYITLQAQQKLDALYKAAGVFPESKAEFTFIQESHCKDCPYLQQAYECPDCRDYHKKRIQTERNEIQAKVKILEEDDENGDTN